MPLPEIKEFKFQLTPHRFIEWLLKSGRFENLEIQESDEIFPQLVSYVRLGGNLFIQYNEFSGAKLKNPRVWHRGEWEICYEKWKTQKWNSERDVQLANLELREVTKIMARLPNYFGDHLIHIARELWQKEDHAAARGLGISMEGIKFHKELLEEVDALMPELKKAEILIRGL